MRRVVNVPQYLEDLTAVLERLPMRDVLRVQEGGRADHDGLDVGFGQHLAVVREPLLHPEFLAEDVEL